MLAAEKAETSRDIPSRLFLVVSAEMLVRNRRHKAANNDSVRLGNLPTQP
jgi:hypothetical protein